MTTQDKWSEWLLHRRFGGDAEAAEKGMRMLHGVRDSVLDAANLDDGATLLDVGAGDGLIAFGALDRVGPKGRVIFCDISRPLLDHAASIARDLGVEDRCSFVEAPADDLSQIPDASVDAVTTRSVLIYVRDKAAALREFHRVLRPGHTISLWEPINSFNIRYGADASSWGKDVPEIADLRDRIRAYYERLQPPDKDPMLDFDERDLLAHAEAAGFRRIVVRLNILVRPNEPQKWDTVLDNAGNPNIPSLREAMAELFDDDERARFERHVRPVVEAGGAPFRIASCILTATKEREGAPNDA